MTIVISWYALYPHFAMSMCIVLCYKKIRTILSHLISSGNHFLKIHSCNSHLNRCNFFFEKNITLGLGDDFQQTKYKKNIVKLPFKSYCFLNLAITNHNQ